jgi:glycosyltransferase involved in cell wall biosynthesis
MHIGVCVPFNRESGGFAQYSLMVFKALADRPPDFERDLITVFAPEEIHTTPAASLALPEIKFESLPPSSLLAGLGRKVFGNSVLGRSLQSIRQRYLVHQKYIPNLDSARVNNTATQWWRKHKVDLLFFPVWSEIAVETPIPYVIAIHDLEHRFQPHFPEINIFWNTYEYIVRNAARQSMLIIADSEAGRQDLLDCYMEYGLAPDRIAVVPYTAPPYLRLNAIAEEADRVQRTYNLPPRYLFYPARFWPHKNHVGLIEALGILKVRAQLQIPLVLVGSHSDPLTDRTFRDMYVVADRMRIAGELHYLGFAKNEDMTGLYGNAAALVMPSFLGPTNIPPIEAWAIGCPVVTSNIRGIREMCGDAALLADPGSPDSIAEAIACVWTDARCSSQLVSCGRKRMIKFSPDNFHDGIWQALRFAKNRLT